MCFVDRPNSHTLTPRVQSQGNDDARPDNAQVFEQEKIEGHIPDQAIETTTAASPSLAVTDELPDEECDHHHPSPTNEDTLSEHASPREPDASVPDDLNSLFDTISPKTGLAKALLCAWWLETRKAATSWSLRDITKAIEDVGRQAQRLSTILGIELRKPQPLISTLPATEGGQHERYSLTDAGRTYVESLLASAS
jgi:hypothetical protein